jgi:predicted small lipoprotein YifL
MKRTLGMTLILLMVNLALAGCGKQTAPGPSLPQGDQADSGLYVVTGSEQYDPESAEDFDINSYPSDSFEPTTEQYQDDGAGYPQDDPAGSTNNTGFDIDLTKLSSTMVFSEVYNMMLSPEEYVGKTIKAEGIFQVFQDSDNTNFYALVIADATACCQQGLELIWDGDPAYPDDYPKENSEIEITGVYKSYVEEGNTYYYVLVNDVKAV